MDAVLLHTNKRGLRFFRKIHFQNVTVNKCRTKRDLVEKLRRNKECFANVLLVAHGCNNAILLPTPDLNRPFTVYISPNEANLFKNDFVFAISCSTANEFGLRCIEEGAIAYLGYKMNFGHLFCSYSTDCPVIPKRITTYVDIIIKKLFVKGLSQAYEEFLVNPHNVSVLRERFSYLLEKRMAELIHYSSAQIKQEYCISIPEHDFKKYFGEVVMRMISCLNNILPNLVCLGDKNYISHSYISYRKLSGYDNDAIVDELESNASFISLMNDEYKQYLLDKARKQ